MKRTRRRTLSDYIATRKWTAFRNGDFMNMARNHRPFLDRLNFMKALPIHDGCVNTICWNKTGDYILSGSDDCNLCITRPHCLFDSSKDYTIMHKIATRQLGNIFRARFMPNSGDCLIASCTSEGAVMVHDCNEPESLFQYNCHASSVYEVVPVPDDDKVFLTCSDDKTIRLFDIRLHQSCGRAGTCPHPALIRNSAAITTLNLHPLNPNLMLAGRADGLGLVYDRRMLPDVRSYSREKAHAERLAGSNNLAQTFSKYRHPLAGALAKFTVPNLDGTYRFTSLCYNQTGTEILASLSGDYLYLFNHDASSQVELIQTLPKKEISSEPDCQEEGTNLGAARQTDPPETRFGGRPFSRINRIRVRGDWSDTGVDSVPYSRYSRRADNRQNQASNFWQHMADVAFNLSSRRDGDLGRLLQQRVTGNNNTNQQQEQQAQKQQPQQESIEEEEEEEEEDDNSTVVDEDENMIYISEDYLDRENDDEHDTEDEDVDENGGHEDEYGERLVELAESTTSRLVDEATEQVNVRQQSSEQNHHQEDESLAKRPQVSAQAKLKFRKAVNSLKCKFNVPSRYPRIKYQGHRNNKTSFKEAKFWGDDFIMSGSDCGRIMVWEKETAKLVMAFAADNRVVNCLEPNPNSYCLASSGIDYDIKLWSTQSLLDGPLKVSDREMDDIVENNELMIEESKQTISVPPHLFFRVLASLAQMNSSNNR